MKFNYAVKFDSDNNATIALYVDYGTYILEFKNGNASLYCEKGMELEGAEFISDYPSFGYMDVVPKERFKDYGVKHHLIGREEFFVNSRRVVIEFDYLRGNIPMHRHPDDVEEAYINAKSRDSVEFCGPTEYHKSFCYETLLIRVEKL